MIKRLWQLIWHPDIVVLPKVFGVCPNGYSKQHVSSPLVDYKVCLNCGVLLGPDEEED